MKRHLLTLLLSASTAACYSYADGAFESVAPGFDVRVEVTPDATERFREALATDQRSLEGRVRSLDGGVLLLDVVSTTRQVGFMVEPLHQTLRLERPDVTHVQLKRLNRGRSAVALTITGVALGAIAWKALGGKSGGDTRPPSGGGTADARIVRPRLEISIPFR